MIRVGPLRRIDRALLGHALHANARNKSEAAHELGEMLKQSTSPSEIAVLQTELARVRLPAYSMHHHSASAHGKQQSFYMSWSH